MDAEYYSLSPQGTGHGVLQYTLGLRFDILTFLRRPLARVNTPPCGPSDPRHLAYIPQIPFLDPLNMLPLFIDPGSNSRCYSKRLATFPPPSRAIRPTLHNTAGGVCDSGALSLKFVNSFQWGGETSYDLRDATSH